MPDPKGTPTLEPRTWMAGSPALAFAAVLAVSGALPRLWPASMSERLEASLAYELVAIHSFLFFLAPIAMRPQMWWHHALRWSWVALLVAFYAGIAWQSPEGFAALGDILLLLFTTYGVYLVRPPDDRRLGGMFYRWVYCFVSFVIIAFLRSALGGGERALFVLGALYFGVLGSLDSINAFERFGAFMRERAASRRRP